MENREAIKIIKGLIRTAELGYNSNPLSKEGEHTATKALTLAISALEKLEAIKNNEPPTSDWEVYSNRLYDAAYKRGYRDGKEGEA